MHSHALRTHFEHKSIAKRINLPPSRSANAKTASPTIICSSERIFTSPGHDKKYASLHSRSHNFSLASSTFRGWSMRSRRSNPPSPLGVALQHPSHHRKCNTSQETFAARRVCRSRFGLSCAPVAPPPEYCLVVVQGVQYVG